MNEDDDDDRSLRSDTGLHNDEEVSLHASQVTLLDHEGRLRRQQEQHRRAFKWRIDEDDVCYVPDIYPTLCCPLVLRDIPVRVIGERVSDFMRLNSIRCDYDNEKARALCTSSCVSFVVQLWKSNPRASDMHMDKSINTSNDGIVIEFQRREGCSIGMHHIRNALVRSIKSDDGHPVRLDMTSFLRRRFRPSPLVKELFKSDSFKLPNNKAASPSNSKDDVRNTIDLLESESFHENDLGIESLCFLSDSTRTEEAIEVACALILRRGELGEDVQNAVEDYLYNLKERDSANVDHKQYFYALSALANSMSLILDEIDEQTLQNWREDDSSIMLKVFWRNMMDVVVEQLRSFRDSPSCAAVAARCVRLVRTLAPQNEAALCVDFDQLPYLLQSAHEYGKAYNAMLEEESFNLSTVVSNVHQ